MSVVARGPAAPFASALVALPGATPGKAPGSVAVAGVLATPSPSKIARSLESEETGGHSTSGFGGGVGGVAC